VPVPMRVTTLLPLLVLAFLSAANAQDAARSSEARPNDEEHLVSPRAKAAGCDIDVHPGVVLKAGEKVNLTWTIRNAGLATIGHDGKVITVQRGTKALVDSPAHTTTYTMSVTGAHGTATCQVSVAVPERTQPAHWPPTALASMPGDYLGRARASLAAGITGARLVSDQRWTLYAIPSLLFEQDVDAINKYFAETWRFQSHPVVGLGLFSLATIRLYGLFNETSGSFPGRLGKEAQRRIEEELYKVASQTKYGSSGNRVGDWGDHRARKACG